MVRYLAFCAVISMAWVLAAAAPLLAEEPSGAILPPWSKIIGGAKNLARNPLKRDEDAAAGQGNASRPIPRPTDRPRPGASNTAGRGAAPARSANQLPPGPPAAEIGPPLPPSEVPSSLADSQRVKSLLPRDRPLPPARPSAIAGQPQATPPRSYLPRDYPRPQAHAGQVASGQQTPGRVAPAAHAEQQAAANLPAKPPSSRRVKPGQRTASAAMAPAATAPPPATPALAPATVGDQPLPPTQPVTEPVASKKKPLLAARGGSKPGRTLSQYMAEEKP